MNICIVGYGAVGTLHAEILHNMNSVRVYGICDTDRSRAEQGAEKYGAKAFYDFDEMLSDDAIHSVHICTPHYLHYEMITKAVAHGKKVVTEKPIVMTHSELDDLQAGYSDCDIVPVFQNRTNFCIQKLKEVMEQDASLGRLISVKAILTWQRDRAYYESAEWRGTRAFEGGGVLINQAIHTLDLMVYLGGRVQSVCASCSNKSLQGVIEVEDTVDAVLKFANGASGIFYATNAYTANDSPLLELAFENASFRYCDRKLYRDGVLLGEDDVSFCGKQYWGSGHERVFREYYENHSSLRPPDVKDTMETMFAIYESAQKNAQTVFLSPQ